MHRKSENIPIASLELAKSIHVFVLSIHEVKLEHPQRKVSKSPSNLNLHLIY